jgi:hypothetical protein
LDQNFSQSNLCLLEANSFDSEHELLAQIATENGIHSNPLREQLLNQQMAALRTKNWKSRLSFFDAKDREVVKQCEPDFRGNVIMLSAVFVEGRMSFTNFTAKVWKFSSLGNNSFQLLLLAQCPQSNPLLVFNVTIARTTESRNQSEQCNLLEGPRHPVSDLDTLDGNLERINVGDAVDVSGAIDFVMFRFYQDQGTSPGPIQAFSPTVHMDQKNTLVLYDAKITSVRKK